jgi:RNA polymerase sigma-70 factor (ECF subfamily)
MKAMDAQLDEAALLSLLRQRDEMAFTRLVEQFHASLVRLARLFVQDDSVAEELCQETWLAVLQGLDRFEGRSSLKTWIFTILTNKAKTRSQREKRSVVFSDFEETDFDSPTVPAERFKDASHGAIEELSAQEICNVLGISETNQRVLLHRARARVREALEHYLQPEH